MEDTYAIQYVRGKISEEQYLDKEINHRLIINERDSQNLCNDTVKSIITNAFWDLHGLDRDNPFWVNTNKLATVSKLWDYSEYLEGVNKNQPKAALIRIALNILYFHDLLELSTWKIVKDKNVIDIKLLIHGAWKLSLTTPEDLSQLSNLIYELHIREEIKSVLYDLSLYGTEERTWANRLSQELSKY